MTWKDPANERGLSASPYTILPRNHPLTISTSRLAHPGILRHSSLYSLETSALPQT